MKIGLIIIICLTFSVSLYAQWQQLNSPTQNRLWSVYFADTSNGWAVGNNGTIIHTTNSGFTWEFQTSGTSNTLYSVCFSNTLKGWITGSGGLILNTTNGGIDWNSQNSGTLANLYWACFIDFNRGWISGGSGIILHTTNSGNTWNQQISGTNTELWEIFFVDSSNGWVVGGSVGIGYCLNTTDGGNTWDTQLNGIDTWLYGIFFLDENIGWVSGNDINDIATIFRTIDGGNTWTQQFSTEEAWWESIFFNDINNGWIVGTDGILHTTDGGTSWNNTNTPTGLLLSVFFTDSNHGWTVGEGGAILRRSPSGSSISVSIIAGWNMLSVPLLAPDMAATNLFPTSISPFYAYNNGYNQVDTLENGKAYWAKFEVNQVIPLTGTHVSNNEVTVNEGWNMIGPFHFDVEVNDISSTPPNLIASGFFGYNNGYQIIDTLRIGKGYWIKVNQSGILHLYE